LKNFFKLQEKAQNELFEEYEEWEIAAGMVDQERQKEKMLKFLDDSYEAMADITMETNDINPKLKESVKAVVIYPAGDREMHLKALYTKSLLHPDQYGKDQQCESKYHKYFGDEIFQDLKQLYGEERAQIVFDEIKDRIYS